VKVALLLVLALMAGGMAWIRLAPTDAARWNTDPTPPIALQEGEVVAEENGARAVLRLAGAAPEEALARLDAIALGTPHTRRLAGSPGDGRITWITRSAVFGFPDYTTASARADGADTLLALYARQRFGKADFGVNPARLRDWQSRLAP
jgi:uncharacterized protein (DUF1499 family)